MNKSIIKLNGLFYSLSSDINFKIMENDIYKLLLPGDEVEFIEINSIIKINKIIKREPQITIGILKGNIISLPLLSPIFLKKVKLNLKLDFQKTYIVLCEVFIDIILIKEVFGEIRDRDKDLEIIHKVYSARGEEEKKFEQSYNDLINSINYVKPFYTIEGTIDLTSLYTFNIDPTNSRDFDDAISVVPEQNKIYVHIVDIHKNLHINSKEEKDALFLGFTLYSQEENLNILPRDWSENKFSLIKDENRNVITFEFNLDDKLKVKKFEIYPSIIKIKKRYNYEEAENDLENKNIYLSYLKRVILDNDNDDWRYRSINVPSRYLKIKNKIIERIDIKSVGLSNKIIEGLMIKCNKIITEFLRTKIDLVPQRFHEKSTIESELIENITDNEEVNKLFSIKKYRTALYSNKNESHHGLKLEKYTHFTSPIRRAFDILIHRILGGTMYKKECLDAIVTHLNKREILNEKLIIFYEKLKLYTYFEMNENNVYIGYIMNINKNGINLYFPSLILYEFIHVSKIEPNTRFKFINDRLINDKSKLNLEIGDKIYTKFKKINWVKLCIEEYECLLRSK